MLHSADTDSLSQILSRVKISNQIKGLSQALQIQSIEYRKIKAHVKGFTRISKEVGNMQMQINQAHQFNHFNNHSVKNRIQDRHNIVSVFAPPYDRIAGKAQKMEAATTALSAEAMALIRQEKAAWRLEFARSNAPETEAAAHLRRMQGNRKPFRSQTKNYMTNC